MLLPAVGHNQFTSIGGAVQGTVAGPLEATLEIKNFDTKQKPLPAFE